MNFDKECADEIKAMQLDEGFLKASIEWQLMASKHKYTYHFKWMGMPFIQIPQDMIAIQEVIWDEEPDFVIETGVARGGGVVFYASILEAMGRGYVVGIDVDIRKHNRDAIQEHPMSKRILLIEGSSTDPLILKAIYNIVDNKKVVVILDSLHTHEHVLRELKMYSPLASYAVVLDTIIECMPEFVDRPWGPGDNPFTAVKSFLEANDEFEIDPRHEKLMLTTALSGYLKRVK